MKRESTAAMIQNESTARNCKRKKLGKLVRNVNDKKAYLSAALGCNR